MKLSDARRVVIFHLDEETGLIDLRHYSINVRVAGVSKSVKSLLQSTGSVKSLTDYQDIGDFILRGAFASESDVEDQEATMQVPSEVTAGNNKRHQSTASSSFRAIKLQELGPRMNLKLVKIQEGVCTGKVIHHELITKTGEEIAELEKRKRESETTRAKRRKEQDENVKSKKAALEGAVPDDSGDDDEILDDGMEQASEVDEDSSSESEEE